MLSDKLAGERFEACLLGVKLFKHPYARNNHANEYEEAGYNQSKTLASLDGKRNSAFGEIVDQYEEVHDPKTEAQGDLPIAAAERHAVLSVAPTKAGRDEPQSPKGLV